MQIQAEQSLALARINQKATNGSISRIDEREQKIDAANTECKARINKIITNGSDSRIDEREQKIDTANTECKARINKIITNGSVSRIDKPKQKIDTADTEFKAELAKIRTQITAITDTNAPEDPCEIIVRGLPISVSIDLPSASSALLTALDLPRVIPHVYSWRKWKLADRVPSSSARPTRTFIMKLVSLTVRDFILKKCPGLRHLTSQSIFGAGGDAKIYLKAIWPTPVYNRLKRVTAIYKSLGYERPIVRNLIVFMRQTKLFPLIPIYQMSDLDALHNGS